MKPSQTQDLYARLGITSKASPIEVKKAYRRMALVWHTDRNKSPDARTQFDAIKEAYDTLSDPRKKIQYDKIHWIFKQESPESISINTKTQQNLEELTKEADRSLRSYDKKGKIHNYSEKGKTFDYHM